MPCHNKTLISYLSILTGFGILSQQPLRWLHELLAKRSKNIIGRPELLGICQSYSFELYTIASLSFEQLIFFVTHFITLY